MNTNQLKSYASQARKDFIDSVAAKAARYGILPTEIMPAQENGDYLLIANNAYPRPIKPAYDALVAKIRQAGYTDVINEIAYTWFNRMIALRYMELHNMLPHGFQIIGKPERPEIMENVATLSMPGLDKNKVTDFLLAGNQDEQLYAYILQVQLNELNRIIPGLFEKIDDPTNLLIPDGLLMSDSIRAKMAKLDPSNFDQIEVIGWLYQFYIAERKDALMAAGKAYKKDEIPAVTQLFTPNWIVKYMVQNTLGSKWLESYPDSELKNKMEFWIRPAEQTAAVQTQLDKIKESRLDPEKITVIDPACGSGHILVEAYDLLREMYLERGYSLRDIPELILRNNLYGIDIDKRAAQLATFALTMKAVQDNPRLLNAEIPVHIINIVESNNMDTDAIANALATRDVPSSILSDLMDNFKDAQTYGSLIRIKANVAAHLDDIADAIQHAENSTDMMKQKYAQQIKPILIAAQYLVAKYDIVVANPPYMGTKGQNTLLKTFLAKNYTDVKTDLFSAFIDQNLYLAKDNGKLGFMTPFVWMFIASYEALRNKIIHKHDLSSLIQLEYSGFDGATVPICTFTLGKEHIDGKKNCFIKLSDFRGAQNQAPKTLEAIRNRNCGWFYETIPTEFAKIPGTPIAYWASEKVLNIFKDEQSLDNIAETRGGLTTGDNGRFLRTWHEISFEKIGFNFLNAIDAQQTEYKWFPLNRGGDYRKWYGNSELVINWYKNGKEIKADKQKKFEEHGFNMAIAALDYMFRRSISWTLISSKKISVRFYDYGYLFDTNGSCVFAEDSQLNMLLAFLNTNIVENFLSFLNPTLNFTPGNVASLPIVSLEREQKKHVELNTDALIKLAKSDWDSFETSWDFKRLPMLTDKFKRSTIAESYTAWREQNALDIAETKRLEEENNRLFIDAYGLADEISPDVPLEQITLTVNPRYRYRMDATDEELEKRFKTDSVKELISYIIGCYMGRYSMDHTGLIYAGANNEGFDASKYTTVPVDDDGVIPVTDTAWFADEDVVNRIEEFVKTVWGEDTLQDNLNFIADALDKTPTETALEAIRKYMLNGFYKDHLIRYQKRPIYWLFTSGKNHAFDCLVYMHRINAQTLARIRTKFVIKLIDQINTQLQANMDALSRNISATEQRNLRKESERLQKQLQELLEYDEKLNHAINQKIEIDLDDGVKVNYPKFTGLVAKIA